MNIKGIHTFQATRCMTPLDHQKLTSYESFLYLFFRFKRGFEKI